MSLLNTVPPTYKGADLDTSLFAVALNRLRGRVWFVDSNRPAGGNGTSWHSAVRTIQAAVNLAVPDDTILVAPGHTETIATATSLVLNKVGLQVIGMGAGSRRPTLTFSATDAVIPISGAGTKLANILITVTGTIDVAEGIVVTGADVVLEDIEMRDSAATSQFEDYIVLSTGAHRCKIIRPRIISDPGGNGADAGISCAVAVDNVLIVDPYMDGVFPNAPIYNTSNAMTNLTISFTGLGHLRQRHSTKDAGIQVAGTTTGQILSPRIRTETDDADGFNLAIVAADMQIYDALVVNADGEVGGAWGTPSAAS